MRYCTLFFVLCSLETLAVAAPGIAPTQALLPAEQQKKFHLPPGFEIQLVVAEPDIGQPMNLNFDARGRLWITHSIEYPYPAHGDVEPRTRFPGSGDHEPRDRLTVIEGIGTDGRPEKITHFAKGLNIPIGNTPLDDGRQALVYSIPNIYRVADTTGDGLADRREVVYGKFGNVDTHGMINGLTRWIDGWVYGCHGFANTSEIRDRSENVTVMNSGNTFRFREDGSRFEQFTWGQVNPFGMTFDPWGNLYDSDCHSMPIYMLLRGAYYPSFGKPHDGLAFGPQMINHGHGSTGICGPAFYAADHFPPEFRGSVFICNPVNCQVHHDRLKQVGSTSLVDTQPDFITCEDGWFRPVDLAVGPDGALYVADFYNCIIGHYEVPLDHPRRDRTHGRVWRIVYKGNNGDAPPPRQMPDLTKLDIDEVVARLADNNLTVRTLATNRLVDMAVGASVRQQILQRVQMHLRSHESPQFRAHGLWVVERLRALGPEDLAHFAQDASPLVRTHLFRIIGERANWNNQLFDLDRQALTDQNATVRRTAADALGRHANADNLKPLLALLAETPQEDTHLIHVARMALRDQLRQPEILAATRELSLEAADFRLLAELAISVKTRESAEFVLAYLDRFGDNEAKLPEYIAFAGQYLSTDGLETLIRVIRDRFAQDLEFQLAQLTSIQTGLERRGARRDPQVVSWASDLVRQFIDAQQDTRIAWSSIPEQSAAVTGDPWVRQQRPSADGDTNASFWCSLPRGERLMATLRSRSFELPDRLSFFAAGHNGPTNGPEKAKNFIRLRDAASGALLMEAKPPRHDTARRIEWDLTQLTGSRGYLELVDGFDATGYAWLAVGRFSLDELNSTDLDSRQSAMQLIAHFGLGDFRPKLEELVRSNDSDLWVRQQAAQTLQTLAPDSRVAALLAAVAHNPMPTIHQQIFAAALSRQDQAIEELLIQIMVRSPRVSQLEYAEILSGDRLGAAALLKLVAQGKASPRLLLDQRVQDRLIATKLENARSTIAELTAGMPSEDAALLQLIDSRRRSHSQAGGLIANGAKVFEKQCATCHQIGGKGSKVGPQLDGIGRRGAGRLVEDILDPNRNVDPTFRTTTLLLVNGRVVSGLIRRTEGETIVLADAKGKEFSVAMNDLEEKSRGVLSLMPANFSESLPVAEFHDLLAYLLSVKQ